MTRHRPDRGDGVVKETFHGRFEFATLQATPWTQSCFPESY
ncbi:hypothetical protein [Halalkalicoccus ordinarius]